MQRKTQIGSRNLGVMLAALALPLILPLTVTAAEMSNFLFLSPPIKTSARLFVLDTSTGQVTSCHFQKTEGDPEIGRTRCIPSGDGAGPVGPGRYTLVRSNHAEEHSVFRVDAVSGKVSICYIQKEQVVCTAPAH
jgi:hypothetical protein